MSHRDCFHLNVEAGNWSNRGKQPYLFIELHNGQRWAPINSTLGVSRLLTRQSSTSEYLEPCVIADSFVKQLRLLV